MRFLLGAFCLGVVNGIAVRWADISYEAAVLVALIVGIGYCLTCIATHTMR